MSAIATLPACGTHSAKDPTDNVHLTAMTPPPYKSAVNGSGWCIEAYTDADGWGDCTEPVSHGEAVTTLRGYDDKTHRVFEVLQ